MVASLQQQIKSLEDIINTLRKQLAEARGGLALALAPASARRPAPAALGAAASLAAQVSLCRWEGKGTSHQHLVHTEGCLKVILPVHSFVKSYPTWAAEDIKTAPGNINLYAVGKLGKSVQEAAAERAAAYSGDPHAPPRSGGLPALARQPRMLVLRLPPRPAPLRLPPGPGVGDRNPGPGVDTPTPTRLSSFGWPIPQSARARYLRRGPPGRLTTTSSRCSRGWWRAALACATGDQSPVIPAWWPGRRKSLALQRQLKWHLSVQGYPPGGLRGLGARSSAPLHLVVLHLCGPPGVRPRAGGCPARWAATKLPAKDTCLPNRV